MAEKITDIEKMKELHKSGVISRATYFRGKKRGYIILDYHKPHSSGDDNFNIAKFWEEWLELQPNYRKIYYSQVFENKRSFFSVDDALNEGALYLIERKIMPSKGFAHFRSYIASIMRGKGKAAIMHIAAAEADTYSYCEGWVNHNYMNK